MTQGHKPCLLQNLVNPCLKWSLLMLMQLFSIARTFAVVEVKFQFYHQLKVLSGSFSTAI